ncbi:MAG: hypothetical protein H0U72_05935 [Nitrosospira sp.]|nr:hypothetical protein [Nitrosospira sp.]
MRTFAQRQKQTQKPASSNPALSYTAPPGLHRSNLILHLQRTIGNHAVQRLLLTHAEERQAGLTDTSIMEGKGLLASELSHVILRGDSSRRNDSPARLSTRSMGESPAFISRQKTSPDETSGNQQESKKQPKDLKQISKDLCTNEPIDDTKAQCQFSSQQSNMVRIIKEHALRTCTRSIAAINMPGNEREVVRIARDYFSLNIKLTEKTKRVFINAIKAVSDKLEHSAIECGSCQDKRCNDGAITHVDDGRTFLVLCPQFFNSDINKVHLTPRILIHEAGHLAKLDENTSLNEEFYCFQGAAKEEKCPVVDAFHNVDAWSHFIEELAYTI